MLLSMLLFCVSVSMVSSSFMCLVCYILYGLGRRGIFIGIPLHLHTDGDRSHRQLCRNLNKSIFDGG